MTQGAGASQIGQIATSKTGDISAAFSSGAAGLTLAAGDLTVNGTSVAADTYTSAQDLADAINTAIGGGSTMASVSGNEITFSNTTGSAVTFGGSAAAGLGLTSVAAQTTGAAATAASVDSAAAVGSFDFSGGNSKSFSIDGHAVTLSTDVTNMAGLIGAINTALGANASDYSLSDDGGKLKIETTATGASASIVIGGTDAAFFGTPVDGADAGANTPGTATSTGVNAAVTAASSAVPLTLANGELTINGTDMEGTYKDAQSLVDAINSKGISGVSAYYDADSKSVHLNSQQALTVAGTRAGATGANPGDPVGLNFAGAGAEIATASNLAASDVKTVAGANDTISRIDAALGTISSMRSDLGAVQNRFTSTIANLQTISQNLSASRSQIQDADFAAETANMSSANILQQAGVSVLAQANATTQSVLKLLQ
jgi:flagellin